MYNAEVKEQFLNAIERSATLSNLYTLFSKTEETEKELDTDLALISREQTISMIEQFGYRQYSTVADTISNIKRYRKWYSETIDNSLRYHSINIEMEDVDLSDNYKKVMIQSTDEIIHSKYPDPETGDPIIPILIFAFYGMSLKDMVELESDNVFISGANTRVILGDNRVIVINDLNVAKALLRYQQCEFGYKRGAKIRKIETSKFFYRIPSRKTDTTWDVDRMRKYVTDGRKKYYADDYGENSYMSLKTVELSGRLNRIVHALISGTSIEDAVAMEYPGEKTRSVKFRVLRCSAACYQRAFNIE